MKLWKKSVTLSVTDDNETWTTPGLKKPRVGMVVITPGGAPLPIKKLPWYKKLFKKDSGK